MVVDGENSTSSLRLYSFLEDNQRLISVLGIFCALTVFASNLQPKPLGAFVSFCLLSISVQIWYQVWIKFAEGGYALKYEWFGNFLLGAMLGFALYWMFSVRKFLSLILIFAFTLAIVWLFVQPFGRMAFLRQFFEKRSRFKQILLYVLAAVLFYISLILSILLTGLVSPLIEKVLQSIESS